MSEPDKTLRENDRLGSCEVALTDAIGAIERKDAAIAELVGALKDAKEMLLRWGCSVPEYSAQKRALASDVAKLDAAIAKYDK